MVNNALRTARLARRVERADGLPFIIRATQVETRVALLEERLVVLLAEQLPALVEWIVDVDHGDGAPEELERAGDRLGELPVGDEEPGRAVFQDERDGTRIEPVVERIEHGARHR